MWLIASRRNITSSNSRRMDEEVFRGITSMLFLFLATSIIVFKKDGKGKKRKKAKN